jgi:hypothetical protein
MATEAPKPDPYDALRRVLRLIDADNSSELEDYRVLRVEGTSEQWLASAVRYGFLTIDSCDGDRWVRAGNRSPDDRPTEPDPEPVGTTEPQSAPKATQQPRSVPKPRVLYDQWPAQNAHYWAIAESELSPTVRHVAGVMSMLVGRFGSFTAHKPADLPTKTLMQYTGLRKDAVIAAAKAAVEAGFFVRIDKANGGLRNGRGANPATYVPTTPRKFR